MWASPRESLAGLEYDPTSYDSFLEWLNRQPPLAEVHLPNREGYGLVREFLGQGETGAAPPSQVSPRRGDSRGDHPA